MKSIGLSRRGFLKGVAATAGAAAGTRLAGRGLIGTAQAAGVETSHLLILHLVGGFNSLFVSADSLVGKFGVASGNYSMLGSVGVDNTWASVLSPFAKQHFASVGIRHGISSHDQARTADWSFQNRNAGLMLANALGGTGTIKAATLGGGMPDVIPKAPEGSVTLQNIPDMKQTIEVLGGGVANPKVPDRDIAAKAITGSQAMSQPLMTTNATSLTSMREGFGSTIETLKAPIKPFSFADLSTAYSLAGATAVGSFNSKMAAAELMMVSGSNVVMAFDGGWDSHGDSSGASVRGKMTSYVMGTAAAKKALAVFLDRMVVDSSDPANSSLPGYGRNVVVCVFGDFARSLPGSDHQPNLTAAVIGKYVKNGTTGRTIDGTVGLNPNTPSVTGWWSMLSDATKAPVNAFGANPHALVL